MSLRRAFPRVVVFSIFALTALFMASRAGLMQLPRKFDPFAPPDLNEPTHWLTTTQLKQVDIDPRSCQSALARAGRPISFLPEKGARTNCDRISTMNVTVLSQATLRPEETRCNIAARLFMWEKHVIQPAAQVFFHEPVSEILHFGSYSCRTIAGSSYMSEHARANAFDVSGFRLKSGKTISVLKDWSLNSQQANFLHAVHDGACDYFNLVLSPDYNAAHRDHFHVDMGWVRGCH
jgi:hypothetical protein